MFGRQQVALYPSRICCSLRRKASGAIVARMPMRCGAIIESASVTPAA